MPEPEYIYRIPLSTRILYAALINGPMILFAIYAGVTARSWLLGMGMALPFVLVACFALWLWSKATIVIDSERIRWPVKRSELRWDDVGTSKVMNLLGTEYARVETKHGKVRRIVLNRVVGQEYRAHVLAKLGLS